MAEDKAHNWTVEETEALIHWRTDNEFLFTGKRNSSICGWEDFLIASGFDMTAKQAKKKWNNLKAKYKELRDQTIEGGMEASGAVPAPWQWYDLMDTALAGQRSVSPHSGAAADLTAAAACSPSASDGATAGRPQRKRARDSDAVLQFLKDQADRNGERERERERWARAEEERVRDSHPVLQFLKDQAEREEERERQALAREEERERAAEARAERMLSLLEKLVNRF